MKKVLCILTLLCAVCTGAWAQTPFTSDSWNGQTTFPDIKKLDNTNATKYVINPVAPICVQQKDVAIGAGTLTVTFQYKSGGSWGLDVVGVDLVKDGVVVKSDYHNCFTGSASDHNTFTLSDVEAGTYTIRYWVPRKTHGGDDLTTTNNNSQGTITYKLDDVVQSQFTNTGWTINTTFRNLEDAVVPADLWKVMRTELFGTRGWAISALSSNSEKYENNNGIHYYDHNVTLNAQDIYVYYRYSGGNHALTVKGTELLDANGKTVAVDFHADALSGNNKNNCTFKLSAPATGNYTLRTIAEGSGGWDTRGNIYYYTQTDVDSKFASVKTALKNNAVGYPKASNANATAIINYDNENEYVELCDHLNKVYGVTDINLPEDGKMYVLTAIAADANRTKHNLYESASENKIKWSDYSRLEADGDKAKFICRKVNDKFVFVNAATGHYLIWRGTGSSNTNTTGYTETYSDHNNFTVKRAVYNSSNTNAVSGQSDLFGWVCIGGYRDDSHTSICFLYSTNNATENFQQDNSNDTHRFGSSHSSMFAIEEVENPNVLKLSNPNPDGTSGLNGKYVGTFSAPYAVELPEGVKAYKAEINDAKTVVTFNEIEGTVVPKNTGVLLYAESGEPVSATNAIPAATAPLPTVNNNIFEPMVNGNITAGNLVLGYTADEGVLFYPLAEAKTVSNKAYIPASDGAGVSSFRFDFEEQTTGISTAQANIENGVAFDLAGRRINANAKGISIMNGQKVIR